MKNLSKFFNLILVLGAASAFAAPPEDLTDQTGELAKRPPVNKPITEDEITFTDSSIRSEVQKVPADATAVLYEVRARSAPGRKGREVQTVKAGEYVRLLGQSKDKRWIAVELLRGKRQRAWLPRSAVKLGAAKGATNPQLAAPKVQ